MTDASELKACPFCNGKAALMSGGPGNGFVRCSQCGACSDDCSLGRAIEKWNSRRPLPSSGTREALEEAQKAMKLLEDLTACGADDDYVAGVQKKIADALAGLPSSDLERKALPLIEKIAAVRIWRDVYPDGPDIMNGSLDLTADDVRRARSVLASLEPVQELHELPAGWKLVPIEPTEAMREAGGERVVREYAESDWEEAKEMAECLNPAQIWAAMLSASPARPGGDPS